MLEIHAPAKINLFLRVLARERSGFHGIETLFCTLGFGDTVRLSTVSSGVSLEVEGPLVCPEEENLAYRAARGFLKESGVETGLVIRLAKRIPAGAGLGGGSSDAAATLKGLWTLFPNALDFRSILQLAGTLGSDVPSFLSPSSLTLAWGRGERLLALPAPPSAAVVLALPPVHVSTPDAYALLDERRGDHRDEPRPTLTSQRDLSDWSTLAELAVNDFEEPVFRRHGLLEEIRAGLRESGATISLLSGSGSALFGVFPDDQRAELARLGLKRTFPGTTFVLTRTERSHESGGG